MAFGVRIRPPAAGEETALNDLRFDPIPLAAARRETGPGERKSKGQGQGRCHGTAANGRNILLGTEIGGGHLAQDKSPRAWRAPAKAPDSQKHAHDRVFLVCEITGKPAPIPHRILKTRLMNGGYAQWHRTLTPRPDSGQESRELIRIQTFPRHRRS